MSFLLRNSLKLSLGNQFLKINNCTSQHLKVQTLKTTGTFFNRNKDASGASQANESASAAKKHKQGLKITLMQNENMTVTALEDAKNLAKRRSMHLVKIQDMDPKNLRPVYKLLTAAEMLQNELSEMKTAASEKSSPSASKKAEKSLSISSRIAEHDLASRLKNISKWLSKQHEVRILIQATSAQDLANGEKIFKTIEETVKTPIAIGRIVQKRNNGNIIKFSILPVTPAIMDKPAGKSQ